MEMIRRNNRFLPELFDAFDNDFFPTHKLNEKFSSVAVNVVNEDENHVIELAVPGMEKSDFQINLEDRALTISAETSESKEEQEKNYTRREFSFGSFQRTFTLPKNIDAEKIAADYSNGVLKITIPKSKTEEKKVKKIEIMGS